MNNVWSLANIGRRHTKFSNDRWHIMYMYYTAFLVRKVVEWSGGGGEGRDGC